MSEITGITANDSGFELKFDDLVKLRKQLLMPLDKIEQEIETIMMLGKRVDLYPHYLEPTQVYFMTDHVHLDERKGNKMILAHHEIIEELAAVLRKLDIEVHVHPRTPL